MLKITADLFTIYQKALYNNIDEKFIVILLLMLFSFSSAAEVALRDYDEFDIPAGTHLPVISLQEFSTAYCEEGDKVYFETTLDIYLYNKDVIPAGTKLAGYIDKKNEPIIGTNAAMRVLLIKCTFLTDMKFQSRRIYILLIIILSEAV